MTNWAIIKVGGGTVTLPYGPDNILDETPCTIDSVGVDGGGAVLISRFLNARQLSFEGNIWLRGTANTALESAYLGSLRGFMRQQCVITDPDGQFGGTWLFSNLSLNRVAEGGEVRWAYTMAFLQGSYQSVL